MNLSLVIPSFKQAPTIVSNLTNLDRFLQSLQCAYEIILVIDGDVDSTAQAVREHPSLSHIIVEVLPKNNGKGFALKHGMSQARGDIVGFIDAGGDIDHECIRLMIDMMQFSHADIVIASKRHPLSEVIYPVLRRIYSAGYQLLYQSLFRLNVRDTQVGAKLFRREVIQRILPYVQIQRFAFDLEVLVLARVFGYTHIIESPVKIHHAFRSTVNITTVFEMLIDTLKLFFRKKVRSTPAISPGFSIAVAPTSQAQEHKHYMRELAQ